jgi:predicted esterase
MPMHRSPTTEGFEAQPPFSSFIVPTPKFQPKAECSSFIDNDDPTLHLPRIMCLHGGGTNARIFRMQCRMLVRALHSSFRLVFAEAPFPAHPGPDVTSVYKNYGPFKAWLRIRPDDPIQDARAIVDNIDASIAAAMFDDDQRRGGSGEWVGLLGFSQGAKLAASILYSQQIGSIRTNYRFALLLAGRGPLVWLHPGTPTPPGLVDAGQPTLLLREPNVAVENILRVPTIHVQGLKDPGLEQHRKLLYQYCDPNAATLVEWNGEHRVPISRKDVNDIVVHVFGIAREAGLLAR